MKVCVLGLGYIGLPTSALLASSGVSVVGVDSNQHVLEVIKSGSIHIDEPRLFELVKASIQGGNLTISDRPVAADVYMICVPTPLDVCDGVHPKADLNYVMTAIEQVSVFLKVGDLVILESTCPVGTTELLRQRALELSGEAEGVYFAYCPERVLPGNIVLELVGNDRIVGGVSHDATDLAVRFYQQFVEGEVFGTDSRTAEMCKLVENAYRDVNIAFANELSMLSDCYGVDVWRLRELANRHPRVNILEPGAGVGGHCIAIDPWFLIADHPNNAELTLMGRKVNLRKTEWVVEKIETACRDWRNKNNHRSPKVVCFGLTFKPETDDLRESPAKSVVEKLIHLGINVSVVDPYVDEHEDMRIIRLNDEGVFDADIIVLLVKHKKFVEFFSNESNFLTGRVVVDFCGARDDMGKI